MIALVVDTREADLGPVMVSDDVVWVRGRRATLRAFLHKGSAAIVCYEGEQRWRVVRGRYVSFVETRESRELEVDE